MDNPEQSPWFKLSTEMAVYSLRYLNTGVNITDGLSLRLNKIKTCIAKYRSACIHGRKGFFSPGKTFIGMVFLQQKRKDTAIVVVAKVRQKRIDSETEEVMIQSFSHGILHWLKQRTHTTGSGRVQQEKK